MIIKKTPAFNRKFKKLSDEQKEEFHFIYRSSCSPIRNN